MRARGFLVILAALAVSCSSGKKEAPKPAETQAKTSSITSDDLAGATYRNVLERDITLVNGRWEGEPAEGGAARPSVMLLGDLTRQGDLDGDGTPETVAFLSASGGGTGSFLHIAVMARREGRIQNIASAFVGDRVDVRDARVEGARVILDLVQAGPEDALCCPGELATRVWTLTADSLAEGPRPAPAERLTLKALGPGEWLLRAWDLKEPAPPTPPVTLLYVDGQLGGKSGCNRWFSAAATGDVPGDLKLGPINGTRMACADSIMAVEARFQDLLEGVKKYGFWNGKLALTYERNGAWGTMLFERGADAQ